MTDSETQSHSFWNSCEKVLRCRIPKYLTHLLAKTGYVDAITVKTITEEDTIYMDTYGKKMLKKYLKEQESPDRVRDIEFDKCFENFYDDPDDFEVVRGDRKLLLAIAAFANTFVESIVKQNAKQFVDEFKRKERTQPTKRPMPGNY